MLPTIIGTFLLKVIGGIIIVVFVILGLCAVAAALFSGRGR
jgi:hypothetical protein